VVEQERLMARQKSGAAVVYLYSNAQKKLDIVSASSGFRSVLDAVVCLPVQQRAKATLDTVSLRPVNGNTTGICA
jgi:hypothetical protein